MLDCQVCRKARATVHLTRLVECRPSERHYCSDCAARIDLGAPVALRPGRAPSPDEASPEARLREGPRAELRCRTCRHLNQENWNYCSACGAMREP